MRMMLGGWNLRTNLVLAAAVVCISQVAWAQDNSSAENKDDVPGADSTTADDRNDVPGADVTTAISPEEILSSVIDLPFKQYVDVTLLRDAYSNGDASTLVDIGLQLLEGERVLQRSHRAFKAQQILDLAIQLAVDQQDTGSLDRLAKAAGISGNKALVESVNVARQLAGQPRDAVPPLPEPSETLTQEDISLLEAMALEIDRARAVGNRATLVNLQSFLKTSPLENGDYRTYLETEIADAIASLPESGEGDNATVQVLRDLAGETRGIQDLMVLRSMSLKSPLGLTRNAYFEGAKPISFNLSTGAVTVSNGGSNITFAKNTVPGLEARYGSLYINYGTFMEIQTDANGNALIQNGQTVRAFPRRSLSVERGKEDQITVHERRPQGGWFERGKITLSEAATWAVETTDGQAGAMKRGCSNIVAVTGLGILPERMFVRCAGSFTLGELAKPIAKVGNITLQNIEDAKGGHLIFQDVGLRGDAGKYYAKAKKVPGGATVSAIVAAGGGNLTISSIVAAGGGNIVAAGGGNIVAAGGGNIVAAGGGNLLSKLAQATTQAIVQDLEIGLDQFLIGKGGAGVLGQDAASLAESVKTGRIVLDAQKANFVDLRISGDIDVGAFKSLGLSSNAYFRSAKVYRR